METSSIQLESPRARKNPDNLYRRGDTWWIRYCVSGRKIRRSLGTSSLREAKHLRDQILVKRSAAARFGVEPWQAEPCKTFAQVAIMWLESRLADASLAPSTRYQNARMVHSIFIPALGAMAMSAITVEDIERLIAAIREGRARSTVAAYYGCLRSIFRLAIRRAWFSGPNPLDRLERPPTPGPGREVALTVEEAQALLTELDDCIHCKSALALYTGLRWGEVHGLGWADIALDVERPTLTVRRSYQGKPKNEASAATIPLSTEATALLRRWRAEQDARGDGPLWVFPGRRGELLARASSGDARRIHAATRRANITKHITPHVFRHTFGTWVYERTGDPKIVQRLMRHASFHTSMLYVHDRRDLAPVVDTLPTLVTPQLRVI